MPPTSFILKVFIFLLVSNGVAAASETKTAKIAIVHSYHKEFEWSEAVDNGFISSLSKSYKIEVTNRYYLDAKRNPDQVSSIAKTILEKLNREDFDLLFVTDDDAMKHIGMHFLSSKKLLVFAGVNRSLSEFGIKGLKTSDLNRTLPKNTTGVLEFYPILPLFELIKKVNPRATRLNIFFDESETSHAVLSRFENEIEDKEAKKFGFKVFLKIVSNDKNKWEKGMLKSNPQTDVNLIFPFSNVRDPKNKSKPIPSAEFAKWITEKSKTIEFATASLTMKFPFFATVGIRGKEHGEDAAEQAKKLIAGTSDNKVTIGKYARLNINPDRAKDLSVQVPFEILAYSHSLQQTEKKNE